MVTSEQDESLRLDAFEYQEIADGLNGVVTTIHVISKKHVATIWWNYMFGKILTSFIILRKS